MQKKVHDWAVQFNVHVSGFLAELKAGIPVATGARPLGIIG